MTGQAGPRLEVGAGSVAAGTSWQVLQAALAQAEDDGEVIPCRSHDADLWTSPSKADREAACWRCGRCPVLDACSAWAKASRQTVGVWGGIDYTAIDRRHGHHERGHEREEELVEVSTTQRQITRYTPRGSKDNDPALWPNGWDVGPHPALADIGWEWIEPRLLPYYKRTAKGDAQVLAEYRDQQKVTLGDPDNLLHRNGHPILIDLTREEGRSILCHFRALRIAKARFDAQRRAEQEAATDTWHTCQGCGEVDRATVKERTLGAWAPRPDAPPSTPLEVVRGARLCDDCYRTALLLLREAEQARDAETARQILNDGQTRRQVLSVFLDQHAERIMEP